MLSVCLLQQYQDLLGDVLQCNIHIWLGNCVKIAHTYGIPCSVQLHEIGLSGVHVRANEPTSWTGLYLQHGLEYNYFLCMHVYLSFRFFSKGRQISVCKFFLTEQNTDRQGFNKNCASLVLVLNSNSVFIQGNWICYAYEFINMSPHIKQDVLFFSIYFISFHTQLSG